MTTSYDAVLILSFGGPEGMQDVMPFLENVTRGRNVPRERLLEVAKHYELFGGVSPINAQNRLMIEELKQELKANGPNLPVYWGNRNWQPMLADTLAEMRNDGVKSAIAFVTSAYSSYSSCRQYLDDINRAQASVGEDAPRIDKIRAYYNHPLFVEANFEQMRSVLASHVEGRQEALAVAFTAHSIPLSMAGGCAYQAQLMEISKLLSERCGLKNWSLVYQSRSGPPQVPWLEPDILDHIRKLHSEGVKELLVHPVGFVSDHMEVVYDLDHEAHDLCTQLGMKMHRSKTAGTHPKFIKMIRELILERLDLSKERPALGASGAVPDICPVECCPLGAVRPMPAQAAHNSAQ